MICLLLVALRALPVENHRVALPAYYFKYHRRIAVLLRIILLCTVCVLRIKNNSRLHLARAYKLILSVIY